jgi:hypothetical protein
MKTLTWNSATGRASAVRTRVWPIALSALGLMLWLGTWAALMIGFSGRATPEHSQAYPITFVRSSIAPNAHVGVEFEGNVCNAREFRLEDWQRRQFTWTVNGVRRTGELWSRALIGRPPPPQEY